MDLIDTTTTAASAAWAWFIQLLPAAAAALAVFIFGYLFAIWAGRTVRRLLERTGRLDATVLPVIGAVVRYGIFIMVIVAALGQLGVPTTSILAALGAAGLAIGLALQGTLSNIAAGIMLLWLKPFRAGESIDAGGIAGSVREIGLFATEMDTFDGIYRFVPNSELWNKPLYNYSRNPIRRTNMEIGVSYGADVEQARQIMLDLANEQEFVVEDPSPSVFVDNLGDSAVTLRFRVWIRTDEFWGTQRFMLEEVKRRLAAAGIEIPFPQRVVHVTHDAMSGPPAASGGKAEAAALE